MPTYEKVVSSVVVETVQTTAGTANDAIYAALVAAGSGGWRLQAAGPVLPPTAPTTPLSVVGQEYLEVQRLAALRPFHAALAARTYAPCNIAAMGASSTEGVGASAYNRRWLTKLTTTLRAVAPVPGVAGGANYVPAHGLAGDWPIVRAGGSISANSGWALKAVNLTASGHTLTYTVTCTSVQVWYSQFTSGGSFTVTIDGSLAATVNTVGSLDRNAKWVSSALTAGSHTVVVAWSAGSVFIYGIASYNGDEAAGIRVYDGGLAGLKTTDLTANTLQWPPRLATIAPSLVVYQPGANDHQANVSSVTFKANLKTIITLIRSGSPTPPSIVLQSAPLAVADYPTYSEPWQNYRDAIDQVAAEDTGGAGGVSGVCVFDTGLRWRSPVVDNSLGIYNTDLAHATDLGHSLWAAQLAAFLLAGFQG